MWALPSVAREARAWQLRANAIPDAAIRNDALGSLARKRGHTDGAALFTILTRDRSPGLLPLLVAYEIAWDFLDSVNERGAAAGQENGRQLHLALIEALDPSLATSDYYRHNPWKRDGGYLRAAVDTCRRSLRLLPAYEQVRHLTTREATRALVLAINHDLDPDRRDVALRGWAVRESLPEHGVTWFELTGAASASLTIHALLATATDPRCTERDAERIARAYFPWISAATTMLDSYVDQTEDAANNDHSYVAHYSTPEAATQRVGQLVERCMREARALPGGEHHALIAACMVAMYLSKDSARAQAMRASTASLAGAGGSLVRLLLPILRLWRITYTQRSA
jgi:tetraprenyl-beta-curcumene synthase